MASTEPNLTRNLTIEANLNFAKTLGGAKDFRFDSPNEAWWSTLTPDGPGTLGLLRTTETEVEAAAWGSGASWIIEQAPLVLGSNDNPEEFAPPEVLDRPWRSDHFRLGRTDRPWDAIVRGILGQKVQKINAVKSRNQIAYKWGEPAPGPRSAQLLPDPATIAELGYYDFHEVGIERKRAETLIRVGKEMRRLDSVTASNKTCEQVQARLSHIRGIGPWTVAVTTAISMGDADAVPVGDFHLPNTISWWLAGEARGTDERMLELLEPFRGQRQRALRIAKSLGSAPKYGPRLSLTGHGLDLAK